MLVNFQDAFIFVISAETEYIFASEDVSMPKGDPSEDEPAPFSSASCSLTRQSLFMLTARLFRWIILMFFLLFCIFFNIFNQNTANFSKYESTVIFKIHTSGQ